MKATNLAKAIAEAERFLERALTTMTEVKTHEDFFETSSHCAALKRSSLDLTKALAKLRQDNEYEGDN
jgi:hypothetical protein